MAPYLNTDSVNAFFIEFEKEIKPDVHVIMIWDRAGFHTSNNVRVPENVTLIHLPAYSPQLNPIEKLWQYLRKHYWSNRVYADYDALRGAAIGSCRKHVWILVKSNLFAERNMSKANLFKTLGIICLLEEAL